MPSPLYKQQPPASHSLPHPSACKTGSRDAHRPCSEVSRPTSGGETSTQAPSQLVLSSMQSAWTRWLLTQNAWNMPLVSLHPSLSKSWSGVQVTLVWCPTVTLVWCSTVTLVYSGVQLWHYSGVQLGSANHTDAEMQMGRGNWEIWQKSKMVNEPESLNTDRGQSSQVAYYWVAGRSSRLGSTQWSSGQGFSKEFKKGTPWFQQLTPSGTDPSTCHPPQCFLCRFAPQLGGGSRNLWKGLRVSVDLFQVIFCKGSIKVGRGPSSTCMTGTDCYHTVRDTNCQRPVQNTWSPLITLW